MPDVVLKPELEQFSVEGRLRPRVDLWKEVFSKYGDQDLLAVNMSDWSIVGVKRLDKPFSKLTPAEKASVRKSMRDEHSGGDIFIQVGRKERYDDGLERAKIFVGPFSDILKKEGLPTELVALPFLESQYDPNALSRSKACGAWQFMLATAKQYKLNVGTGSCGVKGFDERTDPIASAGASVEYLKDAKRRLGDNWPEIITSYNQGVGGMSRALAVKNTNGWSFSELIEKYQGKNFGFDGQNYYAQFVAALELLKENERYPGTTNPSPLKMLKLPERMNAGNVKELIPEEDRSLNPAIMSLSPQYLVPKDAKIHLHNDVELSSGRDALARRNK